MVNGLKTKGGRVEKSGEKWGKLGKSGENWGKQGNEQMSDSSEEWETLTLSANFALENQ